MAQNYNDLTGPFEGTNAEWNDLEATVLNDDSNDLTLNTQNEPPGASIEWNTEM